MSFWMLLGEVSASMLTAAGVLLTFAWTLAQPLLSGLCSEADRQGRVVCVMGCVQTVGFGLGPALAAWLVNRRNFAPVIWVSTGVLGASLLVLIRGLQLSRHAEA